MPLARGLRNRRGRAYRVPFLEVVLTVDAAADADRVQHCLDSYLDSDLQDLRVVLVGPWDQLTAERVPPLTDPLRDLGILHRAYRHEPRVDLVGPDDPVVTGRCRSPFRLTVTATDLAPRPAGVRLVVSDLERTSAGRRTFTRSDGREVASLTRTAAYSRADWFGITDSDERDAFVTDTFGGGERPAAEAGWVPVTERVVKKWSRVAARTSDEESWALVRAAVAKGQSPPNRSRV